jgi:hypothetical protein
MYHLSYFLHFCYLFASHVVIIISSLYHSIYSLLILVFKNYESNKNSHKTWLILHYSNCYEMCFMYLCIIIAAMNQMYYYGYALLDIEYPCEQFQI